MDIQLSSGEIFRQFPSDVAHAFCALGLAKPLSLARAEAQAKNEPQEPVPTVPTYGVVRSPATQHLIIVLKKPDGSTTIFDGHNLTDDRQIMERLARDCFKVIAWDQFAQARIPQGVDTPEEIVKQYCDAYFADLNERQQLRNEARKQGYAL